MLSASSQEIAEQAELITRKREREEIKPSSQKSPRKGLNIVSLRHSQEVEREVITKLNFINHIIYDL